MLTKGAIGNLINRYKAVLAKCNLINTFGSLAVASMLVLGGAGVAGAATYNNFTSSETSHLAALMPNSNTYNEDVVITTESSTGISTDYTNRVYGIALTTDESGTITGSTDITLTHTNEIRAVRLNGVSLENTGPSLELGTVDITASVTGSGNQAVGLDARYNAMLTTNGNVSINLSSTTGRTIGIDLENNAKFVANNAETFSVKLTSEQAPTSDGIGINGMYIRSSFAEFNADLVDIDVKTTSINESSFVNGIRINESDVNFNGDVNVKVKDKAETVASFDDGKVQTSGIFVTNNDSSSTKKTTTFTGTTTVNVTTAATNSYGIMASAGSSAIKFSGPLLDITSFSNSGAALGICTYGTNGSSSITLSEDTEFKVLAQSVSGAAYGVYAKGGTAVLNGAAEITATGQKSYGIVVKEAAAGAGSFESNGNLTVTAATALTTDAASAATLGGEATLNGNVEVAGTLNVDGTANLNGETNNIAILGGSGELMVDSTDTQVNVDNLAEGATASVKATGNLNDQLGGDMTAFKRQLSGVAATTAFGGADEGYVAPAYDENGKAKGPNSIMDAALKHASVNSVSLDRILTNDVRKRMGDLRSDKNTSGVWMRWDGGKLKGDTGLSNDFNTIQIGGDTKVGKNCRLGVAGSFTHGDGDFARGSSELEGFSFAAYSTWMGENGMFADIVARLGHFSTEMNVEGNKGDMDNRVFSLSGEYGWRLPVCDQFFVEPQVELAYTYVSSDDLELGTAKYAFDSVNSLTGRAGVVFGWNLPDDRGNVYARASVLQQFMGDAKISGAVTGGKALTQEIDGNDTWLEYGIGANVKLTEKTYVWADVERTEGAKIDEEWRGTVGIRYSF